MCTGRRKRTVSSAVTDGNRYQVARIPAASSSAAATRPPWTKPGPAWWCSAKENCASYSRSPSLVGCGKPDARRVVAAAPAGRVVMRRRARSSAASKAAALEVRLEEVGRAGRGHRGRRRDLQRQRRRRDDLREAVDLSGAGAIHQPQPGAGVREGRAAANRADLEAGEAQRDLEAALHSSPGSVAHRARPDHAEVLAGGGEDRRDRRRRRERDGLHPGRDGPVRARPGELEQVVDRRPEHPADRVLGQGRLGDDRLPVAAPGSTRTRPSCRPPCWPRAGRARASPARAPSRSPCSGSTSCGSSCSPRRRRRSSSARGRGTSGRRRGS